MGEAASSGYAEVPPASRAFDDRIEAGRLKSHATGFSLLRADDEDGKVTARVSDQYAREGPGELHQSAGKWLCATGERGFK